MATAVESRPSASISIKGLSHQYKGGTRALDQVELTFGTGLFGLLGPNGAGKSTLMRIICTLLVPTAGTVTVRGHDVVKERKAVREILGYLPQEFGGWRLHKVSEVLDTVARLAGDGKDRKARIAKVLEQVGLSEVANRKVKKLSGGMRRRLGVAQALIRDPEVLVVDEPTVGLDPQERLRFRQLMADLAKDRTILLSTHIVADLGSACRDIALIDAGKLAFRGSPADLVTQSRGKVFEVSFPAAAPEELGSGIEIVSRTRNAEGTSIRAVTTNPDKLPGSPVEVDNPTLEEAYLAFMAARGRVDAAISEEL
ncbi:hypothetical protein ABI59_14260 [Acidobacteria bacterium Mor1]|nr:hypothetical protein ABI59_14260 [Acidobacteria bacterium Mor1]